MDFMKNIKNNFIKQIMFGVLSDYKLISKNILL